MKYLWVALPIISIAALNYLFSYMGDRRDAAIKKCEAKGGIFLTDGRCIKAQEIQVDE